MPHSGSGTMQPAGGGGAVGPFTIAQPLPYTLLSLPRYARIMGINPVHFACAATPTVFPVMRNACQDVWSRYSWQADDRVGHEDLAYAILQAEQDIAAALHYWPAPVWRCEEVHPYPTFHRPDAIQYGMLDARGYGKGIVRTDYGYVIAPGVRALEYIGTGVVAYSDQDADGFNERATVTIPTTYTNAADVCQFRVYFASCGGAQEWEIRPARSRALVGGNFIGIFDSWLFIDPDEQSAYPTTAGYSAIDITTTTHYVASVELWREYNDPTDVSARLYWEPTSIGEAFPCSVCGGTGCSACTLTTQDGCIHVRDAQAGIVVPAAATYDTASSGWGSAQLSVCRDPDYVKIWYRAGLIDNKAMCASWCDYLSDWWALTIAMLATARLERPFCSCASATALAEKWQQDLQVSGSDGVSYSVTDVDLSNPFGTRRGESLAWKRIAGLVGRRMGVALA